MPTYNFKPNAEFWWFVGVAVVTVLMQAASEFDATKIGDPKLWAVGVLSGAVRAAGGAVLAWVAKSRVTV